MRRNLDHTFGDPPLAYFLTWTTYGTWLPGDERGWYDKPGQFHEQEPRWEENSKHLLTEAACLLDAAQRQLVESTIYRHCEIRGWQLYAVNCRTNHVHVVVAANEDPETIMNQFKAWCTRRLKENAREKSATSPIRQNWWTQRGSKRYINDLSSLESAVVYVKEGQ